MLVYPRKINAVHPNFGQRFDSFLKIPCKSICTICHKRITPCITNLLGKSVLREKQASLIIVVTVVSLIYVIKPLGALTQILVWRCHDFCDIFMATLPGPVI